MSISAVGSAPVQPISMSQTSASTSAVGNDGDGNDEASGAEPSGASEATVQASPAPGTGTVVDKTA